jgi:hypothetical protein
MVTTPIGGGNPRTLDRETLLAERARITALPKSDERKMALRRIGKKIASLDYRSERNGV